MRSELYIMKRHVDALFTHNDQGRLRRVNEPDGAEAPRFFLGRTVAGNLWRFRFDLPESLSHQLEDLCFKEPAVTDLQPANFEEYLRLIEKHSPVKKVSTGPAYMFPAEISPSSTKAVLVTGENADLLLPGFEDWIPELPYRQPFLAILSEGRAVSLCCSVRITSEAHEAGVETLDDYRRRGYASNVVRQWATEVLKMGVMPLYSTSWQNIASQGVAKKLRLVQYGSDFHIS